jgi:hypothetical protein
MAAHGTDLTLLTNAESGTWTEFTPYSLGGSPSSDGENYIQGTDCISQSTGTKTGLNFSIVYDAGSDISGSFTTNDVVLMWQFYAVGVNLETFANGGLRLGIGSSLANINSYKVGGRDFSRNPYGGWMNVAVDPTKTADYTDGTGNGGAWRYFGSIAYTLNAISKGTPHAVDAIRYGRGEIYCVGTGCNFDKLSIVNDQNTSAAFTGDTSSGTATISNVSDVEKPVIGTVITGTNIPAGTTITAINEGTSQITISQNATGTGTGISFSQYNRLGLFQNNNGTFLLKGLMSIGQTGTSATFSDSNKTILIDDTPSTFAGFNKIAFNNTSTSVTWTNITFKALGTFSKGEFEMIDNCTANMTGCSFIDMSTLAFYNNATLTGCAFIGCGIINHRGSVMTACDFQGYEGTANTAYLKFNQSFDPDGNMDDCSFTKGTAATHAIEFGTVSPLTMTLRGISFSGYNATDDQNDSTLWIRRTSGTVTINLVECTGNISYKSDGATVVLVPGAVTTQITVKDIESGSVISGARVLCWVTDNANYFYQASVSITGSGTTATVSHTAHGMATGDNVIIAGVNEDVYNGAYTVTVTGANSYTYTTNETIGSSPATGTPISTFAIINEATDGSGIANDSRPFSVDQPMAGWVRQGTTAPYYIGQSFSDTIDSVIGFSVTIQLVRDS